MESYAFISSVHKRWIHVACISCYVAALLLFGISGIDGMEYPIVYQLTAIVTLTVGIYLTVRYALKMYRYEISESGIVSAEGDVKYDLVVTEITGAKRQVVARIGLWDVESVHVLTRGKKKAFLHTCKGRYGKIFAYTNNPFDPVSCAFLLPEEDSVIMIPADDGMLGVLKKTCRVETEN